MDILRSNNQSCLISHSNSDNSIYNCRILLFYILINILINYIILGHAKGKDHGDEEESREMLIVNGNANARDESEEETDLFNVQRDRT